MRKSVLGLVATLAVVGSAALAPSAQAVGVQCNFNYEQPFWSWSDANWYGLAPGANFEAGGKLPTGWTVGGGAAVKTPGNPSRPWSSSYSLYLPSGGNATTPAFCVDAWSPFSRMFAQTATSTATGGLRVDLIYTNSAGKSVTTQVATLAQRSSWGPTETFPLISGSIVPKWDRNGQASVKYKFTAINKSAWRIDDLFIDPKKH